ADYEYVAVWTMNIQGLGDCLFIRQEREICKAHMARTGGQVRHYSSGSCGICGNQLAIYLALFYHAKTNEYITVGVDCAQKLDMCGDFKAVELFKRRCADAREQQAGKRKAIALLGDAGLMDAWEVFTAEYPKHAEGCGVQHPAHAQEDYIGQEVPGTCTCGVRKLIRDTFEAYEETTIRDIVGKLVKYGNISDNQKAFVSKLLGNIARRPIIEAQRKAEHEAAAPVQSGRLEVTGTVLAMKEVEAYQVSRYSPETAWKLLIRLDDGSKVWGSRFANLNKGDRIRFTATFEPSKDDPKFGFYKRPVASPDAVEAIVEAIRRYWPAPQEVSQ